MADSQRHPGGAASGVRALRGGLLLVGVGLLANAAVALWNHHSGGGGFPAMLDSPAFGQPTPNDRLLGAKGLYMMPAQLGPTTFGLYLMDVDSQAVAVYRAIPDTNRFKLMAVRGFRHDVLLEDFNNETPTPKDVAKQVQIQRQREQLEKDGGDKKDPPKDP